MKSTILFLLATLFIVSCGSNVTTDVKEKEKSKEELTEHFTKDLKSFLSYMNEEDWDSAFDYIYPKLFNIVSKEQMIGAVEQAFQSGMEMKVSFIEIDDVSAKTTHEKEDFCKIQYKSTITMTISQDMLEIMGADQFIQSLEAAYGIGAVNYNEDKGMFVIDALRIIVAIADKGTMKWKYIEYNPGQEQILTTLLPSEVIKEFDL